MQSAEAAAAAEFSRLRPLCTAVMKDPTLDNIMKLNTVLLGCPREALQALQAYVMFPLEAHLRAPQTRLKTRQALVDSLKILLKVTEADNINTFFRIYTLIFNHLYDKDQENLISPINEELKVSLLDCACELLKKTPIHVKMQVYEVKNIPWLSQGVYVCVQIQQHEKYRPLRITAIECLMLLNQTHDNVQRSSIEIQEKVADVFAAMLPGVLAGITATLMGDPKQGHAVIVVALEAWWKLLVLLLGDSSVPDNMAVPKSLAELVHSATVRYKQSRTESATQDTEAVLKNAHGRTVEWQRAAASKVERPIILVAESLRKHGHPSVRKSLAVACQHLLENSARILSGAIPSLIDTVVVLSEDSDALVSKCATTAVSNFSERLSSDGGSLITVVENRLHSLVEALPELLHCRQDEEQQLSALHQLKGYLRLLAPAHLLRLSQSPVHCRKLVDVLLDAAELDTSGISLLEDCGLRDDDAPITRVPWRSMRHLFAPSVVAALEKVCKLLGSCGHLDTVADTLLQLVFEKTEAALILNMVIAGVSKEHQSVWPVVRSILDIYLEPAVWYRPLSVTKSVPLGAAQTNLMHACILVEGVGIMYEKVPEDSVPQYLLRTLFLTLERVGSPHKILSDAGMAAARAMSGGNVSSLVWSNADYLAFHTARNLRLPERQQGALAVLGVLLRHSHLENLPQLRDMVGLVISQTEHQDDERSLAQLHVMRAFVGCVRSWLSQKQPLAQSEEIPSDPKRLKPVSLVTELLEYKQNKHQCLEEEPETLSMDEIGKRFAAEATASQEQEDYNDSSEDHQERLPPHVAAVREVLSRCLHTLPRSHAPRHQVISLETLTDGVHCLRTHSSTLLRLTHKIWEAMAPLFRSPDPLVLARCFTLLCALAYTSGDFLRSRCIKLALPPLFEFLRRSAHNSTLQDSASAYRFTQAYKLQLCLLQGLGRLAAALSMSGRPLRDLVAVCAPYLSSQQPRPLQESCVELFMSLYLVDADIVWFSLVCLWYPTPELVPPPTNKSLEVHKLPGSCGEDSEYKKNVSHILQHLQIL
ncbi:TELO2-interacting protein 1 homolog isoform X1 [Schistocerca cancellata]|uniref:TELO2-interacting protein 1 homolog isoform X1 n=1 Tax=Schistocerca cancellata TaxID=274614 RepID=UPI002118E726|nr:TELO2-interacting protein 1 homolog isoform X1 [Schistocerca cancellata]